MRLRLTIASRFRLAIYRMIIMLHRVKGRYKSELRKHFLMQFTVQSRVRFYLQSVIFYIYLFITHYVFVANGYTKRYKSLRREFLNYLRLFCAFLKYLRLLAILFAFGDALFSLSVLLMFNKMLYLFSFSPSALASL